MDWIGFNKTTREAAWSRMEAAGAQLMSWFGVACELHRDWRNDVEGLGTLFANHLPACLQELDHELQRPKIGATRRRCSARCDG